MFPLIIKVEKVFVDLLEKSFSFWIIHLNAVVYFMRIFILNGQINKLTKCLSPKHKDPCSHT